MLSVGQIISSRTNPAKKFEVLEADAAKATIKDLKTGDEKELKMRTLERNYLIGEDEEAQDETEEQEVDVEEVDAEVEPEEDSEEEDEEPEEDEEETEEEAEEEAEEEEVEEVKPKTSRRGNRRAAKEETEEEPPAKEEPKAKAGKGKTEKPKADPKPKADKPPKEAKAKGTAGRKPREFTDIEDEYYNKTVTESDDIDGKHIRTESYVGTTADWSFARTTKNNSFNKAELIVKGEPVKLDSPSKAKVAAYLEKELKLKGLRLA